MVERMKETGIGAPPASQDRATDAPHGAAKASPPSGSVSTGAGFTAGPWEVHPGTDGLGRIMSLDICLPSEPEDRGAAVVASVFAGEDTARLIAAAPDLYEALETERVRLEEELTDLWADGQRMGSTKDEKARIAEIKKALATLALARGEAS